MKILTIVSDLGHGGTQRAAVDVALCYKNHGHDSAVLTRNGSGPRSKTLLNAGIQLFTAQKSSTNPNTPWNTQAKNWHPDIIHIHRSGHQNQADNALLQFLKNTSTDNKPKIIEHSHFGRYDNSLNQTQPLIDAHIQISKWCLWRWKKWTRHLPQKPIGIYIPHMVNANTFTPAETKHTDQLREQHNIPQNTFVFGFLAQPHPSKRSPTLFNAFKTVAQQDPTVHLMVAGLGETCKPYFKNFPEHIKSRITILPFIQGDNELRTVYSTMDTFVHSTRIGETFGFILSESMACQTPVVTMENPTRDNAQSEMVGHKRGGLVAANPKALVQAMTLIKNNPKLHQHCKIQGRKHVVEHFNKNRVSQMLIALLNHVHQSTNKTDLAQRINQDPLLQSTITTKDLHNAAQGRIGSHSIPQRLTQFAIHTPTVQQFLYKFKHSKINA